MHLSLRAATQADLPFARELYFGTMRYVTNQLPNWDEARQVARFAEQFLSGEVHIIVRDGADVRVKGAGGEVVAPAEVTDGVRPGVVSLPHGWGHDRPGTRMRHASAAPGVNVNQLLDGSLLDPLSGNAVLNGVPVELTATS